MVGFTEIAAYDLASPRSIPNIHFQRDRQALTCLATAG